MDLSVPVNIKEVTCPICLALLTEPLSLDCGHSFCQACITAKNKESVVCPRLERSCPVCQTRYQPGNLRPNWYLAHIVEKVKEVKRSPWKHQKRELCVHHGEKLQIFCKEDGKVICWRCELSPEHRGHQTFTIDKVVKECQSYIQTERQKILKGFNEMRSILDSEEQRELQKLEEEEVNVLDNLAAAKDQLGQQKQCVRELITDLLRRTQGTPVEMLQDVIDVMKRSESWTLKKPKAVSKKLKHVFRAPDLSRMLQVFKELRDVQCHWVDVMLNPVNTVSNVVISADQRQVKVVHACMFRNLDPRDFSAFGVLGCQYFSSGRYYWEVDVSGKVAWILGVHSKRNNPNKTKSFVGVDFDPNANHQNVCSRYNPQNGYWVIGLQNEFEYNAFEYSSSNSKILTLSMSVLPHRIGVFLDCEAGIVSFFNVTNQGSLIYKFSKCCFSLPTYPYFNPWNCPGPMTLCPPST
ncbi:E3 ubiquitin-protein ligase TRIM22 [Tupaia chinensis]|uniref:E3 ubiquitin-protein ligase TRIM22 n=1 Tax=Tupaia chinensis TaxID=246437 RepID=L8YBK4_TUPCH|nr:E3 ubiquitin-protein ligase TRIM22 [Tupaia chinensis]